MRGLILGLAVFLTSGVAFADFARLTVAHAREQTTWNTMYDPAYVKLKFPGGDIPKDRGVCTDVIVRALRYAGFDLQELIYLDKGKSPASYPHRNRDKNIDHRRVPNQAVFFRRWGMALKLGSAWKPGDIVYWKLDNGRDHVGILTDRRGASGNLTVVHNIAGTAEEDCLTQWKIVGHWRPDSNLERAKAQLRSARPTARKPTPARRSNPAQRP